MKSTETKWIVTYGPKAKKLREKKEFYDVDQALLFFAKKQDLGMHVDAYKETTTTETEHLTP